MEGLVMGESPYVALDVARLSALSPAAKTSFPTVHEASAGSTNAGLMDTLDRLGGVAGLASLLKIRLPNTALHFDLRTLNLHLAMRATEIVELKESMWEWVVSEQTKQKQMGGKKLEKTSAVSREHLSEEGSLKHEMLEINRDEFEAFFVRFEMCVLPVTLDSQAR